MKKFLKSIWYLELPSAVPFFDNPKNEVSVMELFFDLCFAALFGLLTNQIINSENITSMAFAISLFYLIYKYWSEITYYFIIYPNRSLRGRMQLLFAIVPASLLMVTIKTKFNFVYMLSTMISVAYIIGIYWLRSKQFTNNEIQKDKYDDKQRDAIKTWDVISRENNIYIIMPIIYTCLHFFTHLSNDISVTISILLTIVLRFLYMKIITPKNLKKLNLNFKEFAQESTFNFKLETERMQLILIVACGESIMSVLEIASHVNLTDHPSALLFIFGIVSFIFMWFINFNDFFTARQLGFGNNIQTQVGYLLFVILTCIGSSREIIVEYFNHHHHVSLRNWILCSVTIILLKVIDILLNVEEKHNHHNGKIDYNKRLSEYSSTDNYLGRITFEDDAHSSYLSDNMANTKFPYYHNIFHMNHNYISLYIIIIGIIISLVFNNIWILVTFGLLSKIYDILTIVYVYLQMSEHKTAIKWYEKIDRKHLKNWEESTK